MTDAKLVENNYVARCKCGCGALVFATADIAGRAHDVAKAVSKVIRDGYVIERMDTDSVRAGPWGCANKRMARAAIKAMEKE